MFQWLRKMFSKKRVAKKLPWKPPQGLWKDDGTLNTGHDKFLQINQYLYEAEVLYEDLAMEAEDDGPEVHPYRTTQLCVRYAELVALMAMLKISYEVIKHELKHHQDAIKESEPEQPKVYRGEEDHGTESQC